MTQGTHKPVRKSFSLLVLWPWPPSDVEDDNYFEGCSCKNAMLIIFVAVTGDHWIFHFRCARSACQTGSKMQCWDTQPASADDIPGAFPQQLGCHEAGRDSIHWQLPCHQHPDCGHTGCVVKVVFSIKHLWQFVNVEIELNVELELEGLSFVSSCQTDLLIGMGSSALATAVALHQWRWPEFPSWD